MNRQTWFDAGFRACLQRLALVGLTLALNLVSAKDLRAQAGDPVPPSFPNVGLLGDNPFKAEPGAKKDKPPAAEDWSIKPSNAPKYAQFGFNCLAYKHDPQKYEKALAYFVQSISCDPSYTPAYMGRGASFMTLHCYQGALEDFDFVLSKEPGRELLYPWRAFVRAVLAAFDDVESLTAAERDLERSRGGNRDEAFIRGARGIVALKRQDYQHAIPDLSWALEHGLDDLAIRYYRALARAALEQFVPAIADLEQVTKDEPSFCSAQYYLGLCHVQIDKPELALVDYRNALEQDPENLEVLFDHLSLALQLKKHDIALADLNALVALHPKAGWAYGLRGLVRWIEGEDMEQVKTDMDRAAELEPCQWCFHACRAVLQCKRTEYAKALGSIACTCLGLRRTEFKFQWWLEYQADGHGRFGARVYWNCEGEDQKPADGAKPADLEHKFADLGLKALWALWLNSVRVN
jgi:tetratricopeptide (TPR) repeat protein